MYLLYLDSREDWNKVEQLITKGNIMASIGIIDFTELAECLGKDVLKLYMVDNSC